MGRHFWLLPLISAALACAGCNGLLSDFSSHADDIGISSGISDIFVSPAKRSYAVPGRFTRNDINVYAVYSDGTTKKIPSDSGSLDIFIDGTLLDTDDATFSTAGTRCIQVKYKGKEFTYTVTVGSSGPDNPGTDPDGGSSIDIVINW
jgi:hypothetical protein